MDVRPSSHTRLVTINDTQSLKHRKKIMDCWTWRKLYYDAPNSPLQILSLNEVLWLLFVDVCIVGECPALPTHAELHHLRSEKQVPLASLLNDRTCGNTYRQTITQWRIFTEIHELKKYMYNHFNINLLIIICIYKPQFNDRYVVTKNESINPMSLPSTSPFL